MNRSPRPSLLEDPVPWRFDFDMFFVFEIDLDAIAAKPPRGLVFQEARPGVGLVGVAATRGLAHPELGVGPFAEINWSLLLRPDLSRPMPVPHLAVFTGAVGSDEPGFLAVAREVDKMPVRDTPGLRVEFDEAGPAATAVDDEGPIFSIWNTDPAPTYRPLEHWIQVGSRVEGGWVQAAVARGEIHEHQRGHRAGVLHPHSFFEGIDVTGLGDRCYLQMLARPGARLDVVFHGPRPLGRRR